MTSEMFIQLMGAVFTIIAVLICAYLVPAIKSVMSEKDMETLLSIIEVAVRSADQLFTKEEWQEKKDYVKQYVIDFVAQHLNIKLTPEQIDSLIEGLVNDLHENGVR